ncbi:MAG: TylF/MycF/NovP-related O-methyltransferase [Sphingomonas sp.]
MFFKARLKSAVGRLVPRDRLEQLTEYAIAEREQAVSLRDAELIQPSGSSWTDVIERGRETLWQRTLGHISRTDILFLEFGVWRGESIRTFTGLNTSANSRFYGFDSFEGLPEDWRGMAAERFNVEGRPPEVDDDRVEFIKGWFQDSLPPMMDRIEREAAARAVVVHFDADLYSSTLFLLFTLGARLKHYHFIFDEFSGHETRALFNYIQATGAKASFLYRLDWRGCPQVVSGEMRNS